MKNPENQSINQDKSFFDKAKDITRRAAIAGSAVLVIGGASVGCTPVEGQETTTTSVSTEITTKPELKDVTPERLEFIKDLLNLYDVSSKQKADPEHETALTKIKDFISREQIIEYGKTGETGENLSIIKYKDGNPAVALINCPDNVVNSFDEMIDDIGQYDPNFLEKMTKNGLKAFMINRFNENWGNTFTFNQSGLVVHNCDLEDAKMTNYKVLENALLTEVFGIKCLEIGGDCSRYIGFVKQQLAADCLNKLYEESGREEFKVFAEQNYFIGKYLYGERYLPITLDSEKIQKLIKNTKSLIEPIGADSWSEIKDSHFIK